MSNKDRIKLTIPSKPEYISLARLTASGIGHEANLNIDELEDLKVCVGEACVNVINCTKNDIINMEFILNKNNLVIEIEGVVEKIPKDYKNREEASLGLLIIKSLMDEVVFEDGKLKLIKNIE